MSQGKAHPDITVGVYGGQVQWAVGHPFPIRIRDYDGEEDELSDVDEQGQRCRTWSLIPREMLNPGGASDKIHARQNQDIRDHVAPEAADVFFA